MKSALLVTAGLFIAATSTVALAKTIKLEDQAALTFFNKHGAELEETAAPPAHRGLFHYVNKNHQTLQGYADCWIQTNAEAVWCTVTY